MNTNDLKRGFLLGYWFNDLMWDFDFINTPDDIAQAAAFARRMAKTLEAATDKPHDGDCTHEPHMCFRCLAEKLESHYQAAIAGLKEDS